MTMKKKNYNVMLALINVISFWLGFKVFTLGNELLIVLVIFIWLILIRAISYIKID